MRIAFTNIHQHAARAGRFVGTMRAQPSWLVKLVLLGVLVALAAVGLLVLIPAVVLGLAVAVVGGGVILVRSAARGVVAWFAQAVRRGDASGRRNVRVVSKP